MYCVVPASHRPDTLGAARGIDDVPLRSAGTLALTAVVSAHAARPAASLDAIRAHNAVVTAAMDESITPVPIRFGQWLDDDDAVHVALAAAGERWGTLLQEFAGCAEFGLRIFDPASPAPVAAAHPRSGREYMASLVGRAAGPAARQAEATGALRTELAGLYERDAVEPLRTRHGVASVAYLVHRRNFDAYHTAVDRVRKQMPHLRYLSTGPWPPYSFVT